MWKTGHKPQQTVQMTATRDRAEIMPIFYGNKIQSICYEKQNVYNINGSQYVTRDSAEITQLV